MTHAAKFPFPAFPVGKGPRSGGAPFWLPLAFGFLLGAAFAAGLAEANRNAVDPTRSDPVIIPPTVTPHSYAPPIRIGTARLIPVSDAVAPARGSAALRRDGGRPLTAGPSFTTHTGRRV